MSFSIASILSVSAAREAGFHVVDRVDAADRLQHGGPQRRAVLRHTEAREKIKLFDISAVASDWLDAAADALRQLTFVAVLDNLTTA
eukprot:183512-Pleurochrysis_carterae.AAC.3